MQVVQEAYVQGVSTRKIEQLAQSLGIENLSRSQVSESGQRDVLAIEPMLEESRDSYAQLFSRIQERGLNGVSLIVSDAHAGLVSAIERAFPGASWQRCKVHFMRNILLHVPHREKDRFASQLKLIWQAPNWELALKRAQELMEAYEHRFPKAVSVLEAGLEESLSYLAFPSLDARKISSNNMIERLNKKIRRRTKVIGIFPNPESYVRLIAIYLMEYAEDWSASKAYLSEKFIQDIPTLAAA